jgi:hypothetical protein
MIKLYEERLQKVLEEFHLLGKNFGQQTTEEETTREAVGLDGRKTMGLRKTELEGMD